jgi:hypothetical protein
MRRKRMNGYRKYGNQKVTTADGSMFDSKKEATRWFELQLLQKAGMITDLRRQVKFVLIPTQYSVHERFGKKGQQLKPLKKVLEQECSYIADFVYHDVRLGETVVEDVKGYRDPASAGYAKFVIKRKLMLERYGIQVREV